MQHIMTYEKFLLSDLFKKMSGIKEETEEIRFGDHSDIVKELQENLESLGFKLSSYGVDGIYKYETESKVKKLFNLLNREDFKNFVSDNDKDLLTYNNQTLSSEQLDLIEDLADDTELKTKIVNFVQSNNLNSKNKILDKKTLLKYIPISEQEDFIARLVEICDKLDIEPEWLLGVMYKESTLNPKAQNKESKATGLIQWMPNTLKDAKYNGITVDEVKEMSATKQLDLVYLYFKPFVGRMNSYEDCYLVVFFPAALGKKDSEYIESKGLSKEKIASQNVGVDLDRNGEITVGEFKRYATKGLPQINNIV